MNYDLIAAWSQIVSSVLFLIVLVWLFRKFLVPVVLAAQQTKNEEIARAERHRDEAKGELERLQSDLGAASQEAEAIRARAGAQAGREQETAIAQAREAGERAVRNAQGELARARAAAREVLRMELLEKALRQARTDAKTRVDARLDGVLVERFVATLEHEASI